MLKSFYAWPDQLQTLINTEDPFQSISQQIQLYNLTNAQANIFAQLAQSHHLDIFTQAQLKFLLFFLYLRASNFTAAQSVLSDLESLSLTKDHQELLSFLKKLIIISNPTQSSLSELYSSQWDFSSSLPVNLLYAELQFLFGNIDSCLKYLDLLSPFYKESLQAQLLYAKINEVQGRWDLVLNYLLIAVKRYPQNLSLYKYFLVATLEAKSHDHAIPALRHAISYFGEHSDFYSHFCRISLLQHRDADSRRYSLKDRLSTLTSDPNTPPFLSNYLVSQERLGCSDWLNFFKIPGFNPEDLPLAMLEPLIHANASINGTGSFTSRILNPILSKYKSLNIPRLSPTDSYRSLSNSRLPGLLQMSVIILWQDSSMVSSLLALRPNTRIS